MGDARDDARRWVRRKRIFYMMFLGYVGFSAMPNMMKPVIDVGCGNWRCGQKNHQSSPVKTSMRNQRVVFLAPSGSDES